MGLDAIEVLLELKADVCTLNNYGWTALEYTALHKKYPQAEDVLAAAHKAADADARAEGYIDGADKQKYVNGLCSAQTVFELEVALTRARGSRGLDKHVAAAQTKLKN